MIPVDQKIVKNLRHRAGLVYTRFVDDLQFPGSSTSGIVAFPDWSTRLLREKRVCSCEIQGCADNFADGAAITNIRIVRGHPDVRREYVEELTRQINDHRSLGAGGSFDGPYLTQSQIFGGSSSSPGSTVVGARSRRRRVGESGLAGYLSPKRGFAAWWRSPKNT